MVKNPNWISKKQTDDLWFIYEIKTCFSRFCVIKTQLNWTFFFWIYIFKNIQQYTLNIHNSINLLNRSMSLFFMLRIVNIYSISIDYLLYTNGTGSYKICKRCHPEWKRHKFNESLVERVTVGSILYRMRDQYLTKRNLNKFHLINDEKEDQDDLSGLWY